MKTMRAFTLWQPWATLMAEGVKWAETRGRPAPAGVIGERVLLTAATRPPAGSEYDPGARPRVGDWAIERLREPTGIEWAMERPTGAPGVVTRVPLPLGVAVASGVLGACVPISGIDGCGRVRHIQPSRHGGPDWLLLCDPTIGHYGPPPNSGTFADWETERIDDQRPYGDFTPGRHALLFDDLARVQDRCPWCWGDGHEHTTDGRLAGTGDPSSPAFCRTCDGRGSCQPFRLGGHHQGFWRWEPSMILPAA